MPRTMPSIRGLQFRNRCALWPLHARRACVAAFEMPDSGRAACLTSTHVPLDHGRVADIVSVPRKSGVASSLFGRATTTGHGA